MSESRIIGQVKWFNNKSGYGFITVIEDETAPEVFVHHSAISVAEGQFRYLVQGEYVTLSITEGENGKQLAANVRGIQEGLLMCEVRSQQRVAEEN